jgi:hypothetical protein
MFANIFGEFGFRTRRSEDQDFAGIADGVQHLFREFLAGKSPGRSRRGRGASDRA